MTSYLNEAALAAVDEKAFAAREPYPWVNPEGLLSEEGYRELVATQPGIELFEKRVGEARKYGQRPHDRYNLEYSADLPLSDAWATFMEELQGPVYHDFVARMFDTEAFEMRFHWHYTPPGGEVSAHCDSLHKLASHLFYLNTEDDWKEEWGGQTLILDDGGRFERKSAPEFDDFDRVEQSVAMGNRSLLFRSEGVAWHGVRAVTCPEGHFRKALIVVINKNRNVGPVKHFLRKTLKRMRTAAG